MKLGQLWGAALTALVLLLALAGCGGSGGAANGLGIISGTVAADGVQAFTADGRAVDTATITLDGTDITAEALPGERFTLRNVPPGLHTLVARTGNRASAVVVAVKRGEATEVGDVVLRAAGSIAGTVTAQDTGSLLPGAKVVVTEAVLAADAAEMPHPVRVTRTNADGFYSLSGIPVGNYLVTVAKPGYAAVTLTLTVAAGATVTGDAALPALPPVETGAMQGVVSLTLDDGSTKPLGGVLVRLARADDLAPERPAPATALDAGGATVPLYPDASRQLLPPPPPFAREFYTFTAEDGSYLLDGVPAGNYVAVAVRPGLEPRKQPVTITAHSTLTVNFAMTLRVLPVATITGTVTNAAAAGPTPAPIAGAWVRAIVGPEPMAGRADAAGATWGADGVMIAPDTYVLAAQTDANGKYTLLVPPVVAAIGVYADGFAPQRVAVTATAGATATADVALQPQSTENVTLRGTVYRPTATGEKTPLAGAKIYAQPMAMDGGAVMMDQPVASVVYTADAGADGAYTLPLRPGVYLLYAEKDLGRSERVLRKVFADGTQDFLVLSPRPLAGG